MVTFLSEGIFKKGDVLKYEKVFQYDNGCEFKSDVTNFSEKQNVDIRRTKVKYKHPHRVFREGFNKELAKQFNNLMDTQVLQNPEKGSTVWVKNQSSVVRKMKNAKSTMIGMKPKDANKLDIAEPDKSEIYPDENVPPEDSLHRYQYQPGEQHGDQKRQVTDYI